ncbi:MAG TPA: hypothetical protein PLL92_00435 [Alicycliphilus sp.]|nr:hypothetical protein [Alicycliphilus sp.]
MNQKPLIHSSRALFYKRETWEKLLRRWATVDRSPESEFLVGVIAQAIEDKATADRSSGLPVTFAPSFMESAIPYYCACIGIDPQFLLEQCNKAFAMEAA